MYPRRNSAHKLSLLYVGTLTERKIEDTIEGLAIFLRKRPEADVFYTIIGNGWGNEIELLQQKVKANQIEEYVSFEGYVPHDELIRYYEISNIGVSYIPITPYYECQPATKTYEYLMAGIPVIATSTYENLQIITEKNGITINDAPSSFATGIDFLYNRISEFKEEEIRKSVSKFEWRKIVMNMKVDLLNTRLLGKVNQ